VKAAGLAGAAATVGACAVFAVGCGAGRGSSPVKIGQPVSKRAPIPAGTVAANFSLRDARGAHVSLAGERGKVVLLTFLYTHCVDVCPGIAHDLNDVLRRLGRDRRDARVIAVSVDPKFDTPAAVRNFEATYRLLPQFRYLVGSRSELRPVWQAYNVLVVPRSSDLFGHSTPIYLVDGRGVPRYAYPAHAGPDTMLRGVRQLLRAR
jgi:protein SCO1